MLPAISDKNLFIIFTKDTDLLFIKYADKDGIESPGTSCSIRVDTTTTISTELTWSEGPTSVYLENTVSWVPSTASDLANQKIQFYTGGNCNSTTGGLIDLNSTSVNSYLFMGVREVVYSYKILAIDDLGNEKKNQSVLRKLIFQ